MHDEENKWKFLGEIIKFISTFGERKIFCNGTRTGKEMDDYGCGIVAAADTLFYVAAGKQIESKGNDKS